MVLSDWVIGISIKTFAAKSAAQASCQQGKDQELVPLDEALFFAQKIP